MLRLLVPWLAIAEHTWHVGPRDLWTFLYRSYCTSFSCERKAHFPISPRDQQPGARVSFGQLGTFCHYFKYFDFLIIIPTTSLCPGLGSPHSVRTPLLNTSSLRIILSFFLSIRFFSLHCNLSLSMRNYLLA